MYDKLWNDSNVTLSSARAGAGVVGFVEARRVSSDVSPLPGGSAVSETAARAVLGYDGSPDADHALDWAADYAGKRGLRLEVLACVGDLELIHERAHQDGERLAKQWLEQAGARLEASGLAGWTTTTSPERVVPALLEASGDAA